MSDAFDYVYTALQGLHDSRANVRAPRATLARLVQTIQVEAVPAQAPSRRMPLPEKARRAEESPKIQAPEQLSVSVPFVRIAPAEGSKADRLDVLRASVLACVKCTNLVSQRTQVVFGVGNPDAELMFVGEAPGEDEDRIGEPFVGRAGELLGKIVQAMGFERGDIFIANVLKCRPDMPPGVSGNRKPRGDEMQVCLPYLREQIEIIQPKVLVALGATALEGLTGQNSFVKSARGRWREFGGIPLMVTYHPAYLLRNQAMSEKRKVWEDMLLVLEKLGRPISDKQRGYFLRGG